MLLAPQQRGEVQVGPTTTAWECAKACAVFCSHSSPVQLPQGVWARVYRTLRPLLREPGESGDGMLDFFHRQMAKAVRRRYAVAFAIALCLVNKLPPRYLSEDEDGKERLFSAHRSLGSFFLRCADPSADYTWTAVHRRGMHACTTSTNFLRESLTCALCRCKRVRVSYAEGTSL